MKDFDLSTKLTDKCKYRSSCPEMLWIKQVLRKKFTKFTGKYLFIKKWLQRKRFSVNFARLLRASTCVSGCFWKYYYNYAWICWFKNFLFDILGRRFTYSFFCFLFLPWLSSLVIIFSKTWDMFLEMQK